MGTPIASAVLGVHGKPREASFPLADSQVLEATCQSFVPWVRKVGNRLVAPPPDQVYEHIVIIIHVCIVLFDVI